MVYKLSKEKVDLAKMVSASKFVLDDWLCEEVVPTALNFLRGFCDGNEIYIDSKLWSWDDYETIPF